MQNLAITSLTNRWDELLKDPCQVILSNLEAQDLTRCRLINKHWKKQADKPQLWKMLLGRDHAFRMNQVQNIEDPRALYIENYILKSNIKHNKYISKCHFLAGDLKHSTLINDLPFSHYYQLAKIAYPVAVDIFNLKKKEEKLTIKIPKDVQMRFSDCHPNLEMLDKDILIWQGFKESSLTKQLLIWTISDQKLIKRIDIKDFFGCIGSNLIAYSPLTDNALHFFDINTKNDYPFCFQNLPHSPKQCKQVTKDIIIVNCDEPNLSPKNKSGCLTWILGFDFLKGNKIFDFDVSITNKNPLENQLIIMPLNENYFILIEESWNHHPLIQPYNALEMKLLGIYDLTNGQKMKWDLPASNLLINYHFKSKLSSQFGPHLPNLKEDAPAPKEMILFHDKKSPKIQLWDLEKKTITCEFVIPHFDVDRFLYTSIISRNRLICIIRDVNPKAEYLKRICLWDLTTGELIKELDVADCVFKNLCKDILFLVKEEEKNVHLISVDLVDGSIIRDEQYPRVLIDFSFPYVLKGQIFPICHEMTNSPYSNYIEIKDYTQFISNSTKKIEKTNL